MAVSFASQTYSGRVNDRSEAFKVLDEQAVKERFVSLQERYQADILLEWLTLGEYVLHLDRNLLLDGQNRRR
jgi:hypothetical protein